MKKLTHFFLVLVMTMVIVGPVMAEGASESDGESSEPVELRFMLWDSIQRDAYETSLAIFEEDNPGIDVTIDLAGWSQYWPKLQTEMASGTAADIFWNQIQYFPTFLENEVMTDLMPYIERDDIDLSKYDQTVLGLFEDDGKLYTITKDRDAIVLIYNKDLFDEVGLPYPDGSMDWNPEDGGSYLETAQQLTLDENGNNATDSDFDPTNIVQYGAYSANWDQPFYWNFMAMNGGGVQAEPLSDTFLLDEPETIEAMQFLADLIHEHNVAPATSATQSSSGDARQTFYTGRIGMITDGNWALSAYLENANFDWGVAPLPTGPEGRMSVTNGIGEAMYAGSDHKEEAWTVLKWFAGEETHRVFANTGKVLSSMKEMAPLYVDYWESEGLDTSPVIETLNGTTVLSPSTPYWNEIRASIVKNYDLLFLGETDAETAGDNIMRDIQDIIDN